MSFVFTPLVCVCLLCTCACDRSGELDRGAIAEQKAAPIAPPSAEADKAKDRAHERPNAPAVTMDCPGVVRSVESELWWNRLVENPLGAMRGSFERSTSALDACADAEALWYALIRGAELDLATLPMVIRGQSYDSVADLVQRAASLYPKSARIWTVRARVLGTEDAARAAVALDAAYTPATVALADALSSADKGEEALSTLDRARLRDGPRVHLTRSRALLSMGQARRAAAAARQELASTSLDSPEPFLPMFLQREAEEALGLALLADHQEGPAHAHFLSAARLGSKSARAHLKPGEWPFRER
jgi:hypothetical protein